MKHLQKTFLFILLSTVATCPLAAMNQVNRMDRGVQTDPELAVEFSPDPRLPQDRLRKRWIEWAQQSIDHWHKIKDELASEEFDLIGFKPEAEYILRNFVKYQAYSPKDSMSDAGYEDRAILLTFMQEFGNPQHKVFTLDEMLKIIQRAEQSEIKVTAIDIFTSELALCDFISLKVFTNQDTESLRFALKNIHKTMSSCEYSYTDPEKLWRLSNLTAPLIFAIENNMLEKNETNSFIVRFVLRHVKREENIEEEIRLFEAWLNEEEQENEV